MGSASRTREESGEEGRRFVECVSEISVLLLVLFLVSGVIFSRLRYFFGF